MTKRTAHIHEHDATGRLHPAVYFALMGFVGGWFLITLTFFSSGNGGGHPYGGLIALIVAVFGLVAVLIPLDIWRIGQHHPGRRNIVRPCGSVRAWLNKISSYGRGMRAAWTRPSWCSCQESQR